MRRAAGTGAACSPASSAEMGVSVAGQLTALLSALALGGAVGLLYDCFRVLRVRVHLRALGGMLDQEGLEARKK